MLSAAIIGLTSLMSVSDAPEPLVYEDALNCSAYLAMLSGANEADGETERAVLMLEDATRWLMLAAARDGEGGERALREMPQQADDMPALLEGAAAANEVTLEAAYVDLMQTCQGLQAENREEFDTALDEEEATEE